MVTDSAAPLSMTSTTLVIESPGRRGEVTCCEDRILNVSRRFHTGETQLPILFAAVRRGRGDRQALPAPHGRVQVERIFHGIDQAIAVRIGVRPLDGIGGSVRPVSLLPNLERGQRWQGKNIEHECGVRAQ